MDLLKKAKDLATEAAHKVEEAASATAHKTADLAHAAADQVAFDGLQRRRDIGILNF